MAKRKRKQTKPAPLPPKRTKRTPPPTERRVTRSMTVPIASRTAVFGTTELLENIMLHMPASDTLNARQVCSGWNETVKESTVLQQHTSYKLAFFDGGVVTPPPLQWCITGEEGNAHFAVWKSGMAVWISGVNTPMIRQVLRRNQRLFDVSPHYRKSRAQTCMTVDGDVLKLKQEFLDKLEGKYSGSVDEPWMHLLLTYPAVHRVKRIVFEIRVGKMLVVGVTPPLLKNGPMTLSDILTVAFTTLPVQGGSAPVPWRCSDEEWSDSVGRAPAA